MVMGLKFRSFIPAHPSLPPTDTIGDHIQINRILHGGVVVVMGFPGAIDTLADSLLNEHFLTLVIVMLLTHDLENLDRLVSLFGWLAGNSKAHKGQGNGRGKLEDIHGVHSVFFTHQIASPIFHHNGRAGLEVIALGSSCYGPPW